MADRIYDRQSQSSNQDGFKATLVRTLNRKVCSATYVELNWDALGHFRLGDPESASTNWDREDPPESEDGVIVLLGRFYKGLCPDSESSSSSCRRFDPKTEDIRVHLDALGHASKVYVEDCIMWDREQKESSSGRGVDSTQDGFRLEVLHKADVSEESSSATTSGSQSCPPVDRCSRVIPMWKMLLYVDALGHLSYVDLDDRNDMACGVCLPCCQQCVSGDLLLSMTLCTERDDCIPLVYDDGEQAWYGEKNIPCGDGAERIQKVTLACERFTTGDITNCFFALYVNGTRNALTVVGCCPFSATQSLTLGWDTCIGLETGCLVPCSSAEVFITERPDCIPYCDTTECPQSISTGA